MALTIPKEADYFILADNVVPGVPKSGYTPRVGHLVKRETAADNEWDLSTTDEVFAGIVVAVNANNTKMSIAELRAGTSIVLPTTGTVALGDAVWADGGAALATVGSWTIQRTRVEVSVTGIGSVVDLNPAGTDTATVRF